MLLISGLGGGGLMCHMFTTVNCTQYMLLPLTASVGVSVCFFSLLLSTFHKIDKSKLEKE